MMKVVRLNPHLATARPGWYAAFINPSETPPTEKTLDYCPVVAWGTEEHRYDDGDGKILVEPVAIIVESSFTPVVVNVWGPFYLGLRRADTFADRRRMLPRAIQRWEAWRERASR